MCIRQKMDDVRLDVFIDDKFDSSMGTECNSDLRRLTAACKKLQVGLGGVSCCVIIMELICV